VLAHIVYFTLKDHSPTAIQHLLDSAKEHLAGHPGESFFAVGQLNPDLKRPVNVVDFHVGLHVIFENKAAHDAYQVDQRHLKFIELNKENWSLVRVFDTDC
jgi:hypothetical protein